MLTPSDKHEISTRISSWYRWQLSFGDKRRLLRNFKLIVTKISLSVKTKETMEFIKSLTTLPAGNNRISHNTAICKLASLFEYIQVGKDDINICKQTLKKMIDNFILSLYTLMVDYFEDIKHEIVKKSYSDFQKKSLEGFSYT